MEGYRLCDKSDLDLVLLLGKRRRDGFERERGRCGAGMGGAGCRRRRPLARRVEEGVERGDVPNA